MMTHYSNISVWFDVPSLYRICSTTVKAVYKGHPKVAFIDRFLRPCGRGGLRVLWYIVILKPCAFFWGILLFIASL